MKTVSLFSGCGGMDLGFIQAGAQVVWANDFAPAACATYRLNIGEHITEGDIADHFDSMPRKADAVIGGFPCVDFSMLGKRRGLKGDSGQLYRWMVKAIERTQPAFFVAENVPSLLTSNDGEAWIVIKDAFSLPGYQLVPVIVNFADYGLPQRRKRLLIIGSKFDWMLPLATHRREVTTGEALANIPADAPNHEPLPLSPTEENLLPYIGEGENLRIAWERDAKVQKYLAHYKHPPRPDMLKVADMDAAAPTISGTNFWMLYAPSLRELCPDRKNAPFNDIMQRLDRNRAAWTLAGSSGTGGGQWRFHFACPRKLTIREIARLQGFPDDFEFKGSLTAMRNQLANAVPPLGIRRIAESLINRENRLW